MQSNFTKSFDMVMTSEGGYTDDPRDSGNSLPDGRKGSTNLGVTQKAWEAFVGHQVTQEDMKALTKEVVKPFYKKLYWDACACDSLPQGVDYAVFDFAVNAGVSRSVKTLQKAVGADPDGSLGSITLALIRQTDPREIIEKFTEVKEAFYRGLSTFATYGKGWIARAEKVKSTSESMLA